LILIIIGILIMLNNLDVEVFRYGWPLLIIILGVYLIMREMRKRTGRDSQYSEFKILGDARHPDFSGEIDGTDIEHIIGDTVLNLIGVQLKPGVNNLKISAMIGDIKLTLPADMEYRIRCSAIAGDFDIMGKKHGTFFKTVVESSPGYDTAEKKLYVDASLIIGDIVVNQPKAAD